MHFKDLVLNFRTSFLKSISCWLLLRLLKIAKKKESFVEKALINKQINKTLNKPFKRAEAIFISSTTVQFLSDIVSKGEFPLQLKSRANWSRECQLYFTQVARVVSNQMDGAKF